MPEKNDFSSISMTTNRNVRHHPILMMPKFRMMTKGSICKHLASIKEWTRVFLQWNTLIIDLMTLSYCNHLGISWPKICWVLLQGPIDLIVPKWCIWKVVSEISLSTQVKILVQEPISLRFVILRYTISTNSILSHNTLIWILAIKGA